MSEVLQYRFPDTRTEGDAGVDAGGLAGHALGQPADRRDDGGRGRRLRGRHPPDEPDPGRPRAGRPGVVDAADAPRLARSTARSSTVSRRSCGPVGIERVWISPDDVEASEDALAAIAEAELIVLGPGSLYTSLLPSLLIPAIRDAILQASAPRLFVCNVATQEGETTGFDLAAHVDALVAHTESGARRRRAGQQPPAAPHRLGRDGGVRRRVADRPAAPSTDRRRPALAAGRRARAAARSSTTSSTRPTPTTTIRSASPRRSCAPSSARPGSGAGAPAGRQPGPPDVSRSERDLVTALRDELAAIDPSRPCDRIAEVDGLGPTPSGREASVARLVHRLRRLGEGQPTSAFDWGTSADHCRGAWLRGPVPRPRLAQPRRRADAPRVRRRARRGARARGAPGRVRPAGLVAAAPRPWRRDLQERRGGRHVPAPDRRDAGRSSRSRRARSRGRCAGELNRVLNAESANLQRAVSAAGRQLDAIATLDADGRLAAQPDVVRLRRRGAPRDARGEPRRAGRTARDPSIRRPARPRAARAPRDDRRRARRSGPARSGMIPRDA